MYMLLNSTMLVLTRSQKKIFLSTLTRFTQIIIKTVWTTTVTMSGASAVMNTIAGIFQLVLSIITASAMLLNPTAASMTCAGPFAILQIQNVTSQWMVAILKIQNIKSQQEVVILKIQHVTNQWKAAILKTQHASSQWEVAILKIQHVMNQWEVAILKTQHVMNQWEVSQSKEIKIEKKLCTKCFDLRGIISQIDRYILRNCRTFESAIEKYFP